VTVPHGPESVSLTEVQGFCKRIGLDPNTVQQLEISPYGLYVTYFATDGDGHKLSDGRDAATHRIFVRFDEEASDDDPPAGRRGSAAGQS
jgi:hypothetical protein